MMIMMMMKMKIETTNNSVKSVGRVRSNMDDVMTMMIMMMMMIIMMMMMMMMKTTNCITIYPLIQLKALDAFGRIWNGL